jgi:hypothetical protein
MAARISSRINRSPSCQQFTSIRNADTLATNTGSASALLSRDPTQTFQIHKPNLCYAIIMIERFTVPRGTHKAY